MALLTVKIYQTSLLLMKFPTQGHSSLTTALAIVYAISSHDAATLTPAKAQANRCLPLVASFKNAHKVHWPLMKRQQDRLALSCMPDAIYQVCQLNSALQMHNTDLDIWPTRAHVWAPTAADASFEGACACFGVQGLETGKG